MNERTKSFDYEGLLNETQAAKLLGFTVRALQAWRCRGNGPAFVKISSRAIRYRQPDLATWINERLQRSTSDAGQKGNL